MEKTTELLRVMRNEKFYRDGKEDEGVKRIVKSYADRMEDAIKRDYTGNVAKLREALGVARELLLPQCHYDIPYSKNCVAAVEKIDSALAEPPTQAEICESMLKSFAECDTSIIRWNVTYPSGGVIAKVEIPRAVYEMLLAAFRKVCRVKLALRKDEGESK